MKTESMKDLQEQIREKADKYAGKVLGKNDDDFPNFHSGDIEMAYKNGADFVLKEWQESERWRKVEEELPEETGFYLCECCNSVGYFYEVVSFMGYWRGAIVRKWKPIK